MLEIRNFYCFQEKKEKEKKFGRMVIFKFFFFFISSYFHNGNVSEKKNKGKREAVIDLKIKFLPLSAVTDRK